MKRISQCRQSVRTVSWSEIMRLSLSNLSHCFPFSLWDLSIVQLLNDNFIYLLSEACLCKCKGFSFYIVQYLKYLTELKCRIGISFRQTISSKKADIHSYIDPISKEYHHVYDCLHRNWTKMTKMTQQGASLRSTRISAGCLIWSCLYKSLVRPSVVHMFPMR